MRKIGLCLVVGLCLSALGCGVEKEKMYGSWVVESGPEKLPKGTGMEFTRDGKLKMTVNGMTLEAGTYSVSGSILTITPTGGKDGKAHITTLTDDKLVLKDDAETKDLVLTKKK